MMCQMRRNTLKSYAAALIVALCLPVAAGAQSKRRPPAPRPVEAHVYLTPTCGCCGKWAKHMEDAGFKVTRTVTTELAAVPERQRVPARLRSCHLAVVDKYIVEGHVPADLIQRLLRERPDVVGLAVPGMPIGSPGMEGPNPQSYSILSFKADGSTAEFARR
jgi:hypothetical protein